MKFNINHNVKVRLTDEGRAEHKRQHNELAQQFPNLRNYFPPKEDAEGWSTWQMHSLMNTFGHMCSPGLPLPFETEIEVQQ